MGKQNDAQHACSILQIQTRCHIIRCMMYSYNCRKGNGSLSINRRSGERKGRKGVGSCSRSPLEKVLVYTWAIGLVMGFAVGPVGHIVDGWAKTGRLGIW